jgi:hypothetical protein
MKAPASCWSRRLAHPSSRSTIPARIRLSRWVNVASLSLMAVVTVQLARAALVDIPAILIALVGAVVLVRWKVYSTWLIAGAALVGVGTRAITVGR